MDLPGQDEQHGAEPSPLAVLSVGDVVLQVQLDLIPAPLDPTHISRRAAAGRCQSYEVTGQVTSGHRAQRRRPRPVGPGRS